MSEYNQNVSFGGVYFELGNVSASEIPSTLKTNIGKTFVRKDIPLRNAKDTVLRISGVITGLSRTSGQTLSQAIEADRAALIALDDGYKHAWSDGKHTMDVVIDTASLVWEDESIRAPGQPYKFSMTVEQWQ